MKKIYILISGTPISIQTLAEEIIDLPIEVLKDIALLLEQEYGITICKKEPDKKNLQELFEAIAAKGSQAQTIVLKNVPVFPIPPNLLLNNKQKQIFPPPKMGKINSKPKGKYRK